MAIHEGPRDKPVSEHEGRAENNAARESQRQTEVTSEHEGDEEKQEHAGGRVRDTAEEV